MMHFPTLLAAISLLYALPSSAQSLNDLPPCAQGPAVQSIGNSGCQLSDFACICKNQQFINTLTPQIQKACSPSDLAKVEQFTEQLCGSVGVSVSLVPTGATSGAASATSAVSAAGSSAASSMATAKSAASSAASSVASSASESAKSATSSATAATATSSSAADGGQAALLREGAISWCLSAIFVGVGGAWVLRGL